MNGDIKSIRLSILLLFVVFMGSCNFYPDDEARIEDLDIVTTYFDQNADFSSYKTYSIVDEVRPMTDDNKDGTPTDLNQNLSDYIISVINDNMQALGYEKTDTSDSPDLGINVGAALTKNISVYSYYPEYYYWYDNYWDDPGYWWGYAGYEYYYPWYAVNTVSSYETGTLIIDMIDMKETAKNKDSKLDAVWTAVMKGIVSSSYQSNRSRAKSSIDQAFKQSPYLNSLEN